MLVAVSQTNDPTGAWWRWSFIMNGIPDYEKMGIWHDGYYMGTNLGSTSSSGDDVYVFERNVMIAGGASPKQIQFHNPNRPNNGFHCIMPLDADGATPPASSPGQFITINDNAWGGNDELRIYECAADWVTPINSTFTMTQQIPVSSFDSQFNAWGVGDIVQQGTSQKVSAQNYTLMTRGQYKNWGTSQTIVCVHTVDVDGTNHAGQRWYELEKTSQTDPTWSVKQESTYAPDSHSRFNGSIAINDNHDIALGYNISSSSMSPNIRYCGQSAGAPTGLLNVAESGDMVSSTQSQTSSHRWGDYSLMTIDPNDGTTFWYTNEYYYSGKKTRIFSFTIDVPVLTANFLGTPTSVIFGNTVTFTDASFGSNAITSWNWSFLGGTPSSYNGQNPPAITYNAIGTYDVSLTVGDGSSTDAKTKTDYINVIPFSYCDASGGYTDEYISRVEFGTIDKSSGQDYYADYTSISTDVLPGNSYNITVTNGSVWSADDLGVWIDWNQDGDFDDANENPVCESGNSGQGTYSISIPANATSGITRMRVRIKYSGSDCGSSCGTTTYGEVEDYSVKVVRDLNLDITVFLEGPYNGTDMNTAINSVLPLSQPFSGFPWFYLGTESVVSIPNGNIVDWVHS